MANGVYDKGRESFLGQAVAINWLTDNIKAVLVRGYTQNLSTHQYLSDVTGAGGTLVATSVNFSSKAATAGVASAANITFTAVAAGAACQAIVIYKDTGVAGTSPLIAYIDTVTGLPVTPNGADINVTWDTGANKIFKL